MARAFSQSQGTFVDVPDSPAMTGATAGVPEGYSPMGDQFSKLRTGLLGASLMNPDDASKYGSILNLAKPTSYETAKQTEQGEIKNITGPMKTLRTKISGGIKNYSDYATFNTQKNLVSQSLAKLIERNRLSDSDRTFYMSNFPSTLEVMFAPDVAQQKLDTVENYLKVRLGQNTSTDMEQMDSAPSSFIAD